MLSSRLAEVNDQLRKYEADNKNLSGHLKHVQDELSRSEKVKQEMLTKSAEIESSKALSEELGRLKASLKAAEDKVKHQEQVDSQKDYLLKVMGQHLLSVSFYYFQCNVPRGCSSEVCYLMGK